MYYYSTTRIYPTRYCLGYTRRSSVVLQSGCMGIGAKPSWEAGRGHRACPHPLTPRTAPQASHANKGNFVTREDTREKETAACLCPFFPFEGDHSYF